MDLFRKHPFHVCSSSEMRERPDMKKICCELKPYCTETEVKQLEQMESMFQTMEMYQEMSQAMNSMQEVFPGMDGDGADRSSMGSMEDILMGMLSPEQKAMYEAFSNQQT